MRYTKLIGACLTVALGACALAASASAAGDTYKIDGIELEAGETLGITAKIKAGTEFVLKGEETILFVTVKSVIRCKKLKLNEGSSPEIIGGIPGTSANELIEFEECSAELNAKPCTGGVTIENSSMNNELVTIVKPEAHKGNLATLFTPASGKTLFKVQFKNCGSLGNQSAEIEGDTAAATSPEGVFEPAGEWAWNETEEITEIEKHNGTKEKVGSKSGGKPATLQGGAKIELIPAVIVLPKKWKFKKLGAAGKKVFNIINATPVAEEVRAGKVNPNENIFKVVGGNGCYEKKAYIAGATCPVTIQAEAANGSAKFEIVPLRFPVFEAALTS